jgi:two-component system chemotaxis response regulator CheB
MFSTLTERGANTTLDALAMGASDYVTKPSNTGSLEVTIGKIKQDLLPKIKALCGRTHLSEKNSTSAPKNGSVSALRAPASPLPLPAVSHAISAPLARHSGPFEILAIGTSTGGPNALADVLAEIPRDFPVPIVIVQHMPPIFTRTLAERLEKKSLIPIREGQPGMKLRPGEAWIAPGDYHMTVERRGAEVTLAMNQGPPENSCRPAVDTLFRSVSEVFGARTLAAVLTGMGADGVQGSRAVRQRGGRVLVQDEATSVVWGMPGQVVAAGCADAIYPLGAIAGEFHRQILASRYLSVSRPAMPRGKSG